MTIERRASVLICDDVLFGVTGKVFLQGVYQSDITIHGDELTINQLVFYFMVETPIDRPFQRISLSVTFPETPPAYMEIPLTEMPTNSERPRIILRAPFVLQQIVLRPGKIEIKAITESDELNAGDFWISSLKRLSA
jgi:hypothetical protein